MFKRILTRNTLLPFQSAPPPSFIVSFADLKIKKVVRDKHVHAILTGLEILRRTFNDLDQTDDI